MDHRHVTEGTNPLFDPHFSGGHRAPDQRAIGYAKWDRHWNPDGFSPEPQHPGQLASITKWDDPSL